MRSTPPYRVICRSLPGSPAEVVDNESAAIKRARELWRLGFKSMAVRDAADRHVFGINAATSRSMQSVEAGNATRVARALQVPRATGLLSTQQAARRAGMAYRHFIDSASRTGFKPTLVVGSYHFYDPAEVDRWGAAVTAKALAAIRARAGAIRLANARAEGLTPIDEAEERRRAWAAKAAEERREARARTAVFRTGGAA